MKLGPKLLIAPLLTAAVALGAGSIYAVLDWRDGQAQRHATTADIENFKTVGQTQEQLAQVRGTVFRTLTIIASLDEAKVKAVRAELAQQMAGVKQVVQTMPGNTGNDAEVT